MKRNILFSILTVLAFPLYAQYGSNVAYQDKNVRFTVITDGALRMEYSPQGNFVDDKSFIAINRKYPPVSFRMKQTKSVVCIYTNSFEMTYKKNSGPFSAKNLSIVSAKKSKVRFSWLPGTLDSLNLKGTTRTLDAYDGDMRNGKKMELENGLLSKSGWTFLDDSQSYLFDHSDWPWAISRPQDSDVQDWYFFAYGHHYKQALRDFTILSGKVPLPPRYAFGYWWSRFWDYSDDDYRELLSNFQKYDIPLDVLVVDMDWHYTTPGLGGWSGYSWNRRLFPDPDKFMKWLKSNDVKITLNLHPAGGIQPYDENYPAMARAMGMNPADSIGIKWQGSNKRFMQAWYNEILRPFERQGVDFWWLDWQQWPNDSVMTKLSNTWWINYTTFTDMEKHRDTRPMLYHRWGGLGNHRYQIGFSGDTQITWNSLDYQPYFNTTASNVLYGYWSHDIGGHMGADSIAPEMYIRWMQFGLMSPILRTHSTKNVGLTKEPWAFSLYHMDILRNIINMRYAFAPYIYTMARKTFDEALPLCRPLYYEYPNNPEAYNYPNEYFFGDNLLVHPITQPMKQSAKAEKITWLPAGNNWYELVSGMLFKGGQTVHRKFALDEMPIYVKGGSILPLYDKVKNLRKNDESIIVTIWPGATHASFSFYEDAGNDKDYQHEYAHTDMRYQRYSQHMVVTVAPREGSYPDMPAKRQFRVKLVASAVPSRVEVNGQIVPFYYEGETLSVIVDIPEQRCEVNKTIAFFFTDKAQTIDDGLIGRMKEVRNIVKKEKQRNSQFAIGQRLGELDHTARKLTYHPQQWRDIIAQFNTNYNELPNILKEQGIEQ